MSRLERIWYRFTAGLFIGATMGISHVASPSIAAEVAIETLLTGMSDPVSVAIKPAAANTAAYEIVVYDRGAGRIVSVRSDQPDQPTEIIKGLASGDASRVLFVLGDTHFVVGRGDDNAFLSVYQFPAEGETTSAETPTQTVKATGGGESSRAREVSAITRTRANDRVPDMLIISSAGENGVGQLLKAPVRADTLGELVQFDARSKTDVNLVSALAVSPQGFIVAAENATDHERAISHITFYNPIDGSPVLRLPVRLREIAGAAFSPISGNLYVAGLAPGDESKEKSAGIYRIDDKSTAGRPACTAVEVSRITRPTSLAFGPDGTLYITTAGDADESKNGGTLQKITGDL